MIFAGVRKDCSWWMPVQATSGWAMDARILRGGEPLFLTENYLIGEVGKIDQEPGTDKIFPGRIGLKGYPPGLMEATLAMASLGRLKNDGKNMKKSTLYMDRPGRKIFL